MGGRDNQIKQWLSDMSTQIEDMTNIFRSGLITAAEIGEDNYIQIIGNLADAGEIIDDVIFSIDNIED